MRDEVHRSTVAFGGGGRICYPAGRSASPRYSRASDLPGSTASTSLVFRVGRTQLVEASKDGGSGPRPGPQTVSKEKPGDFRREDSTKVFYLRGPSGWHKIPARDERALNGLGKKTPITPYTLWLPKSLAPTRRVTKTSRGLRDPAGHCRGSGTAPFFLDPRS
jgi:hypothetical protein